MKRSQFPLAERMLVATSFTLLKMKFSVISGGGSEKAFTERLGVSKTFRFVVRVKPRSLIIHKARVVGFIAKLHNFNKGDETSLRLTIVLIT